MADSVNIFPPPAQAIEVTCLHCGRVYMSDLMIPVEIDSETHWMCPVPYCGAMGYLMDIFPADGVDEEQGYYEFEDDGEEGFDQPSIDVGQEIADEVADRGGDFDPPRDWSPGADEDDGDCFECDDDGECDSIYFTLEDFEAAKAAGIYEQAVEEARAQWKSNHDDSPRRDKSGGGSEFTEDDIPF